MTEVAESVESLKLDELKELLEESVELAKETNKLLKRMRRDALIGGIAKFLFWIVIIVVSTYLSFQFLQPYLSVLNGGDGSSTQDFGSLYNQYKGLLGQ